MPNRVPAYPGQCIVVHRCDCHVQATKGCKALYLSGVLSKLQLWSCLSQTAKLSLFKYRCRHISCICFGVLLAPHRHIGCGKGVNCSWRTLLCSCTKVHCTCVVKSCTPGSVLAWKLISHISQILHWICSLHQCSRVYFAMAEVCIISFNMCFQRAGNATQSEAEVNITFV